MPTTPDPFNLPEALNVILQRTEVNFGNLLQNRQYEQARHEWENLYQRYLLSQIQENRRLHKGGVLHNMAVTDVYSHNYERALKCFYFAYAEDVLSEKAGWGRNADEAPAALNITRFFGMNRQTLKPIRAISETNWDNPKFWDSVDFLHKFVNILLRKFKSEDAVADLKKEPVIEDKPYTINKIPGDWNKRVFIGGNYRVRLDILKEIKSIVLGLNYQPIFAHDFNDKEPYIHDHSLILLHSCKYAIFDVSKNAGYLMELERTVDYRIRPLLVYQEIPEEHLSEMVKSLGMTVFEISDKNDEVLPKLINDYLGGNLKV